MFGGPDSDPTNYRRQCHIKFENGYTLSITWSTGSYSHNKNTGFLSDFAPGAFLSDTKPPAPSFLDQSPTAEIAIWRGNKTAFNDEPTPEDTGLIDIYDPTRPESEHPDDVLGWVTDIQLREIINQISNWPDEPRSYVPDDFSWRSTHRDLDNPDDPDPEEVEMVIEPIRFQDHPVFHMSGTPELEAPGEI